MITILPTSNIDAIIITAILAPAKSWLNPQTEKYEPTTDMDKAIINII